MHRLTDHYRKVRECCHFELNVFRSLLNALNNVYARKTTNMALTTFFRNNDVMSCFVLRKDTYSRVLVPDIQYVT